MGNTEPTDSKLKIYIETQKVFYNSGSKIEGVVYVNAQDNFGYDALFIRVEGDQFCQWFEGSSKNRRKYTGIQNFYAVEHMLCKYEETLLQGKYVYPFSLELSENIPGTYKTNQYDARVDYKLIAYFANFNDKKKRAFYSIPLYIREPFRQEECEYEGTVTENPKTCCCFSKGDVTLHARFSTNVCFEGENVDIQFSCDNTNGRSNIKRLAVDLVRYTFVSANNGISRTYKKVIKTQYLNSLIQKGGKLDREKMSFQVGNVDHQTAISTLVANYYRLEAYVHFGNFATSEPCIYSPLFIMKKNIALKQKTLVPKIDPKEYRVAKKQIFKAPEYWFRKNKNLSEMNFRLEDNVGPFESEPMMGR